MSSEKIKAKEKLIYGVLRLLGSERAEPSSSYDAELEYCDDMILEAAKELTKIYENDPS